MTLAHAQSIVWDILLAKLYVGKNASMTKKKKMFYI